MSQQAKFRFSYRLFIKSASGRDSIQLSHSLQDSEPTDIEDIAEAMHGAVNRAMNNFKQETKA
jgi:hypothetical protein